MTPRPPAIVAHRGLGFGQRENTCQAFAAVRAHGGIGVELDVRLTRDGIPVVHHDRHVETASGRSAAIDRLRRVALPAYVPTLADALEALGEAVFVDLEIKPTERSIAGTLEVVGARQVRLSSFSAAVLTRARALAPSLPRALLIEEGERVRPAIAKARALEAEGLHVHVSHLDEANVGALRDAGLAIRAYTLNAEAEWRDALRLGIDAIITDRPRALATFMRERAQAPRGPR
jgi:glycerophosphoryl diester phosphodiesterase